MNESTKNFLGGTLAAVVCVALVVGFVLLCVLGVKGCNNFNRAQARKNAENKVKITHINIKNAREQADIVHAEVAATRAEKEKREVEAQGIAKAQQIINNGLTERYIQHELVNAMKAIATSGQNNSVIYIPTGSDGLPLIKPQLRAGEGK